MTGEDRSVPLPVNVDRLRAHLIHAHSFCGQCQGFAATLDAERAGTRASAGAGLERLAAVLRTLWPNDPWIDAETIATEYARARTQQLIDKNGRLLAERDRLQADLARLAAAHPQDPPERKKER